jgi:hypothetical protein
MGILLVPFGKRRRGRRCFFSRGREWKEKLTVCVFHGLQGEEAGVIRRRRERERGRERRQRKSSESAGTFISPLL